MKAHHFLALSLVLLTGSFTLAPVSADDYVEPHKDPQMWTPSAYDRWVKEKAKFMSPEERRKFLKEHPVSKTPSEVLHEMEAQGAKERANAQEIKDAQDREQNRRAQAQAQKEQWTAFNEREQQQLTKAKQLRKTGKTAQAIKFLETISNTGSPGAPYMLGTMYLKGDGVKQDKKQALSWFYKAARNGSSEGAYEIARAYMHGDGVPNDLNQSISWLKVSKVPEAQHLLGAIFEEGVAGQKNYSKAWDAFKESASANYAPAEASLGEMCYLGLGMHKNFLQAKKWFEDAVSSGDAKAYFYLSKMYEKGDGVEKNEQRSASYMSRYKDACQKLKPSQKMEQKLTYKEYDDMDNRHRRLTGAVLPSTTVGAAASAPNAESKTESSGGNDTKDNVADGSAKSQP